MSYLMDYGDDWPGPPREPARGPVPRGRSLGERCVLAFVLYFAIWLAGAVVLQVLLDAQQIEGTTTYVTTTISPHPASPARHR